MNAAEVAAVLGDPVTAPHNTHRATCPACGQPKGILLYDRGSPSMAVVLRCECDCNPATVRDLIAERTKAKPGKVLTVAETKRRREVLTVAELKARRAVANRMQTALTPPPRTRSAKLRCFKVQPVEEIDFDPNVDGGGLIEGLLPEKGVAVMFARYKSFKTFVTLDLAWAVGCKPTWAGHRINKRGAVVYIACEGTGRNGIHKRIAALKRTHGDDELPPFYLIEARPNFGFAKSDDVKALIEDIRAALPPGIETVLIVIDTLARTLAGKDENGEGMRNFLDNAEDLADAFECLVLAVHHEGAGDSSRARGSTVLPAGVVAIWHLMRDRTFDGFRCKLVVDDAKDSASNFAFTITLRTFEFGDEHDERRESTLLVDTIELATGPANDDQPAKRKGKRPPPDLGAFMTSVSIALDRHGIEVKLPDNGPTVKAVRLEYLRSTYYQKRADLDPDSKRMTFRRQSGQAIGRELVVTGTINGEPMLWLASKP